MKVLQNEKGSALIYVLLIFAVSSIALPLLFSYLANINTHDTRSEFEKLAYNLAVSGMQAYTQYPETLETNYGYVPITLPNGNRIDYYQYGVPTSSSTDFASRFSTYNEMINSSAYIVVIKAIAGDNNQNQKKDHDEKFFFQKIMMKEKIQESETEKTTTPVLNLLNATTTPNSNVTGSAEAGAVVTVIDQRESVVYKTTVTSEGTFSLVINRPLNEGDVFSATAISSGKVESNSSSTTVLAANAPVDDGYVIIEDEAGNQTIVLINPIITTADKIIIKSEIGSYTAPSGKNIEFTAADGIIIEEGVSLTSSGTGSQNQGLMLTANSGDIVISGTILEDNSNSVFSNVIISAKTGSVYMENTRLVSESNISVSAAKNIHANASQNISKKKTTGAITFTLDPNIGIIFVENMYVNKNASALPNNAKLCGTLTSTSYLLNGSRGPFNRCN